MTTPFCFTKDILYNKSYVINTDNEGEYVPWVANRVLSNYTDTIFFADEMNLYPKLPVRMQFDYYFHAIRKNRRPFIKYPKAEKSEYMSIIMESFGYSSKKAREALAILTTEQLEEIKERFGKGG